MRIEFNKINSREKINYSGDLNFFSNINNFPSIKEYKKVEGFIEVEKADSIIIIKYDIHAVLTVLSTLSNEPFEYPLDIDETYYYTDKKEMESEDVFYIEEGYIDLDQEIYSLIVTSLPLTLHKKDEVYPKGEKYRVLKEEEINDDDGSNSSPFDILKDLDLDN